MLMLRIGLWMFSVALMVVGAGIASGQIYPNKPVRILTAAAGGTSDFGARIIAQGLTDALGQRVIVDNRVAIIAVETAAKAPPDGYSLLFMSNLLWAVPLMQKTPFDPVTDFLPISLAVSSPNILVVHPSLPVKSVKELVALAKVRPGELNYATSGVGGSNHLAAELFKAMAGVNIVRISYKGGGALLMGVLIGEAQMAFGSVGATMPHLKSGRLRALAVTSARPSALLPGLPTVAAAVPGYESRAIYSLFAPAGTPATIISQLNQEIVRVLNRVDVKEKFFNVGQEVIGSSPEQLAATVKSEMAQLGKVIKDAGIRAD